MTDLINLSHISVSPHREAYESFMQYDRFSESKPFDPRVGLYKMAQESFGRFEWEREEKVFKNERIYPSIQNEEQKPDDKDVLNEVQKRIDYWNRRGYPLVASNIILASGNTLLEAGTSLTEDILKTISLHNIQPDQKPISTVPLLTPEDDEGSIIEFFINKTGISFDANLLRRIRKGSAILTGYRICFPNPPPSSSVSVEDHLESLYWKLLQLGGSMVFRVDLQFEIKEDRVLTYNGSEVDTVAGKSEKVWRPLGAFPLFTSKDHLLIRGQERVPVIQLLPGPGFYTSPAGTTVERSLLLRPEQGPSLKIGHTGVGEAGYCIYAEALGQTHDLINLLKDFGFWEESERIFAGPDPHNPILPNPESVHPLKPIPPDWASRV